MAVCVLCLFLALLSVGLWDMIVAFPGHTHLLLDSCTVKPVLSSHLKEDQKLFFLHRLSFNAGQKYCRMLPLEHSAILSICIKLPCNLTLCLLVSSADNLCKQFWIQTV